MSDLLREKYTEFRAYYETVNPPPEAAGVPGVFWLALGIVAAGALSIAIRTYGAFYAAATGSGLDLRLSQVEAIGAMVFVEGGVILYEAIRAHHDATRGKDIALGRQVALAVGLFVAISATAGLHQSLHLLGDGAVHGWFGRLALWTLAFVQGIGGTAALWVSGSVLGHIAATGAVARRAWEANLRRAWESSEAYLALAAGEGFVKAGRKRRNAILEQTQRSALAVPRGTERNGTPEQSVPTVPRGTERGTERRNGYGPATRKALAFVERYAREHGEAPGPRLVMREAGVGASAATRALEIYRSNGEV